MKVCFPHTNPIAFERLIGEYQPYMDAYESEGDECWAMPILQTDLLTFQMYWRGNVSQKIRFVVDAKYIDDDGGTGNVNLHDFYITSDSYMAVDTNTPPAWGVENIRSGAVCNGFFYFNRLISNFGLPVNTKYFRISVGIDDIGGTDYTYYHSSWMKPVTETKGTKLVQYTDSREYHFDTFFGKMPNFYSMRLPAVFLHPSPKAEKEVFQGYDMSTELVSASPYETVTLEIGGNKGLPDYIVRNLNFIFHCDTKTIDGVEYELSPDANFEPQRVERYNLSWLDIELCPKDTKNGIEHNQGSGNVVPQIVITPITIEDLTLQIEYPENRMWRVQADSTMYLSRRSGMGSAEVTARVQKNLTASSITYSLSLYDVESNTAVYAKSLIVEPVTVGIGYGIVGDTLYVKPE